MPVLPETQAIVLGALLGRVDSSAAARLLREGCALPAARRLQIYRNNLVGSLSDALEAVYPAVARLVGARYFRQLAHGYIVEHPSRAGNLHDFGSALPEHIAGQPGLVGLPYLADVAHLEWACHEVYHEADSEALAPALLAQVAPDMQLQLRLNLAPATRLLTSAYPVLRIWTANRPGADEASTTISLEEGGVHLLVARRNGEVEFRVLGDAEYVWLRALASNATLAEATAAAIGHVPDFDLGGVLSRHLSLGTFARMSAGGSP